MLMKPFSQAVIQWQKQHGRHHLPWQKNRTAYRVWISEIMLQQTQVKTVLPYFERFMNRFSDIHSLGAATIDEVLFLWSGLGYYSRARNLHRSARKIMSDFSGAFPDTIEELQKLPGIGRSTAGAIMTFAHNRPAAILDGNVKRVLVRQFAVRDSINLLATQKHLWSLSEELLPAEDFVAYTQGLMDLGSMICTRTNPSCEDCPVKFSCAAFAQQAQHDLPNREKKKDKPLRQQDFVLVAQQQHILLKQKGKKGVWSDLWCLPSPQELAQLEPAPIIAMGPKWLDFRHTFSHFHLDCDIYQATFERVQLLPQGWIWYNINYPAIIGLAAPMKRVIEQWFSIQSGKPFNIAAEPHSSYNY